MNQGKVLIVEDQSIVALDIKRSVEKLGYSVTDMVDCYEDTLKSVQKIQPDIILIDINLNDQFSGIDTAYKILETYDIPIIYLTAYSDDETIQKALATNPVGYILKPFSVEELKCALLVGLNKNTQVQNSDLEYLGEGFYYDLKDEILYLEKTPIKLSFKEKKLLNLLYASKNNVVPMQTIEYTIWPDELVSHSSVRTLLYRLRTKLHHKLIETIPSFGCKLNVEN